MEEIKHFSHKHRLTLHDQKRKEVDQKTCNGCRKRISSDFYGCKRCDYYICKSCDGLPRGMRHPFHREHPLTLLAESPYESGDSHCHACSKRCDSLIYNCSECKFDLDVNCATLMPNTTKKKNYYYASSGHEEEDDLEEQQITHPHPLIPCHRKNKEVDFLCSVCELPINTKGTIYACLDCRAIMDESCAQLPQQITHHFHPHHSLTLKASSFDVDSYFHCKVCPNFEGRFCYSCSECAAFDLDVRCASLMPKTIIMNYDDDQSLQNHLQEVVQVPFTHGHVLIPSDTNGNFSFFCSACYQSIEEGTVYVCLECRYFLHKSCAELPQEINHPFHPQHPLVLLDDYSFRSYNNCYQFFACEACSKFYDGGFRYWCAKCQFDMDIACASLTYSTFKFDFHQHPLTLFNKRNKTRSALCRTCEKCRGFPFFSCVPCNSTIGLCCLRILPDTFKHSEHGHSLTLTYSPIKDHSDDDDDSVYYCDLCEETREPLGPTYYCQECPYVAEVSCVFNEILQCLRERVWSLAQEEEIVMLQSEVDALTAKLETLITKLDELKERCAHHIDDCQVAGGLDDKDDARAMEVKIKNASIDKKAFLSAARDDPAIVEPNEEIIMLLVEIVALAAKLETETTKLDGLKMEREQHIDWCQIGSIPSLGTKSSVTILDADEVVGEDCSVKSTKKNEEENEDEESDGTFSTLAELDEEIAKLEALTAKLEVLKKKRALLVSCLEIK